MLIGFFRKRELGAGDTGPNCLRGQKGMSSKFHSNGTESRVKGTEQVGVQMSSDSL